MQWHHYSVPIDNRGIHCLQLTEGRPWAKKISSVQIIISWTTPAYSVSVIINLHHMYITSAVKM